MGQPPRPRAVRARQRSRTSLRAFADPLRPIFPETGIDKLQVRVNGQWRSNSPASRSVGYLELLTTLHPSIEGMRTPVVRPQIGQVKLAMRKSPPWTLSVTVNAQRKSDSVVDLVIEFKCNPTRTLAHLLARLGVEATADRLRDMDCLSFFRQTEQPPTTFGGQDNWIADLDVARAALGEDIFTSFLPPYVMQLRRFASMLVAPTLNSAVEEGGEDDLIFGEGEELRLHWGQVKAPQAEAYFERHHGGALQAVRTAANNVLTSLHTATVRHYLPETGFERLGDKFSIRSRISDGHELSVYAKTPTRIRFEIARTKAGRYGMRPASVQPGASARLLHIMVRERDALIEACRWDNVGQLLAEHGVPLLPDLLMLIRDVQAACSEVGRSSQEMLATLLTDGGVTLVDADAPLVTALKRHGVLERVSIRVRDRARRYTLAPFYRSVHLALLDTFGGSD